MIVLASASPRRRELLERVGLRLEVRPASIDETPHPAEEAISYARRVCAEKVEAIAAELPGRWIIGADTVVEIDGAILGKAESPEEARQMLERLVGRTHRVTTAFRVRGPDGAVAERAVTTDVVMRAADDAEIADYVTAGEWRGKAGAYAVQGMAAALVSEVRGSITNVIGLPLCEVVAALRELGGPQVSYVAGLPA